MTSIPGSKNSRKDETISMVIMSAFIIVRSLIFWGLAIYGAITLISKLGEGQALNIALVAGIVFAVGYIFYSAFKE